jgi:hypothetical protein
VKFAVKNCIGLWLKPSIFQICSRKQGGDEILRIEIDKQLAKLLDGIKAKEPSVYGRGHVETVRFLANYYSQHKPFEKLLEDFKLNITEFMDTFDNKLEASLEQVFPKALAQFITNILTYDGAKGDAEQPRRAVDLAARHLEK